VPLRVGERNVGRLELGRRRDGAGFAPRELECLQKTADVVAVAVSVPRSRLTTLEGAPDALISKTEPNA
jgi:hypothetical protein